MIRNILLLTIFLLSIAFDGYCKPKFQKCRHDSKKIDIVYTWVDNQDQKWQKALLDAKIRHTGQAACDAKGKQRFRNRDELKYSLRSIHAFAPFVNHIYIVTFGHRPKWLRPHHKVSIVSHNEIFKNESFLPTFNSQAIEANLHRIPGLSERFIYFNDDVLLGRKVSKEDFFSKHGKIKVLYANSITQKGIVRLHDNGFIASWKNANRLLDNNFGRHKRRFLAHAPFALRKSHLEQLERWCPQIFTNVSSHAFRSPYDYVITCGLTQYFARYSKQAKKAKMKNIMVPIRADVRLNKEGLERILKKRPHTFCIEDVATTDSKAVDRQVHDFFEHYFPNKAPWEL